MTPQELDRRRPVWDALSDVFLDTETRWEMPRIGFVLVESGYSAAELDAIFWNEIVPECAWNLLQVAGEWALLVVDEEKLAARADGNRPLLERMLGVATPLFIGGQWRAILALREALLALPAEDRRARTAMWTAFIHVYLEASLEKLLFLDTHVKDLRATGASTHALLAAFDAVRPTFRTLLVGGEMADEERRARDVRELIACAAPR
jgi:hypothetical protein